MSGLNNTHHLNSSILADLIGILKNMTSDWDMGFFGKIGPDTYLIGDLAFESINFVQLAEAIEQHFKRNGLPFQELMMDDDRLVDDLKVSDLEDFLETHLSIL